MENCRRYHTQVIRKYTYHPVTGAPIAHDMTVGVCWGSRECERCLCGGDAAKCDFYPEKRSKVDKEPRRNLTNADKIRAMTDKELADFLIDCDSNIHGVCHEGECLDGETCTGCMQKWLKQPSK